MRANALAFVRKVCPKLSPAELEEVRDNWIWYLGVRYPSVKLIARIGYKARSPRSG